MKQKWSWQKCSQANTFVKQLQIRIPTCLPTRIDPVPAFVPPFFNRVSGAHKSASTAETAARDVVCSSVHVLSRTYYRATFFIQSLMQLTLKLHWRITPIVYHTVFFARTKKIVLPTTKVHTYHGPERASKHNEAFYLITISYDSELH